MPRPSSGFSGSGGRGSSGGYSGGRGGSGGYGHGPRGPHGPYRHYGPHYGGFFFFPWRRRYYGYGGFYGGFFALFFLPILILIIAAIFLISSIVSLVSIVSQGGVVTYDSAKFRDYALTQYDAQFDPTSAGYEDNILIVFSTVEGYDEYHVQAMIGNNIIDGITYMFDSGKEFDRALTKHLLADDYSTSLDRCLYSAIDDLTQYASSYSSSFLKAPAAGTEHKSSRVINMDEALTGFSGEYTQTALDAFTEETGISVVLIIEDEEDIFGRSVPAYVIVSGVISLGICIFAGVWIFKAIKAKKQANNSGRNSGDSTDYNDPRYWN